MSAALIPANLVPVARTDADWAFDIDFQGEDWTGDVVKAAFALQGLLSDGTVQPPFEITLPDPTADLACALRLTPDDFEGKKHGTYSVEIRRFSGDVIDDAAVFRVMVYPGLSDLNGAAPPPAGDGVATGGVIVSRVGHVTVVRSPAGPVGPAGPGGAAQAYTHFQTSASALWNVNHNLGQRPTVSLLTTGGVEFEGAITHLSANQFQVQLSSPQTGSARCI